MKAAILVPVGNAKVRDPKTKNYLLHDGETKPLTGFHGRFWKRRIRDGSVAIKSVKLKKKIVKVVEVPEKHKGEKP